MGETSWGSCPCAQAKRGGLHNTDAIDMLDAVFKGIFEQTKVDPKVRP